MCFSSIKVLKKVASASIAANEAVWFGCDVGKHCSWKKHGVEDLSLYNHELLFGLSVGGLDKAQRLLFRESLMTHAMVLTAVSMEVIVNKSSKSSFTLQLFTKRIVSSLQSDKTLKWRIENSWGDDGGEKGKCK